jgi:hypothetical protein
MGSHPINLAVRFLLEMSALASVGVFGWIRFEGPSRWIAVIGLPLLLMTLWGTFAVPGDPSRSGSAPVPVSGSIRLTLELIFFAVGAAALYSVDHPRLALVLAGTALVHYLTSWDRIS